MSNTFLERCVFLLFLCHVHKSRNEKAYSEAKECDDKRERIGKCGGERLQRGSDNEAEHDTGRNGVMIFVKRVDESCQHESRGNNADEHGRYDVEIKLAETCDHRLIKSETDQYG